MNILFLATWFPSPPDNGSKLRVYHLLRALSQGHEVSLLSFAFATARPDEPGELHAWCRQIEVVSIDPFQANRAGALRTFLSPRPVASRPVPAMSQLAARALHAQPYDAVIASTGMMVDYALQAPPGAARILEEHNAMTRWAWESYLHATGRVQRARRWLSWRKSRWYEARTYPRFDMITMVSQQDRQATLETIGAGRPRRVPPHVAATNPSGLGSAAHASLDGARPEGFALDVRHTRPRVEVVPNGVDCAHNRPGLAQPQPASLVFNGSLTYSANYDAMRWFLEEVYPRVRAQVREVTLTITGSTLGVDLAGLALDDSVHLTGFVQDVRIPVAEAAVAIAPIRQGGGTRLKILEAMALGTPVVATSKGAEGLDVVDGEYLLLADDPERFASQTIRLVSDADLHGRLAANARHLVETRYDWQQIGQKFVALVGETVAQVKAGFDE